jgi:flavin-binding protein dodecin
MSVAKTIEILAEGDTLEDATEEALREASTSVNQIKNIYVDDYRAIVEDNEISTYRVHAKVTFLVE